MIFDRGKLRKMGNSNATLKMIQKTFDDRPSPRGDEADLLDRFEAAFMKLTPL